MRVPRGNWYFFGTIGSLERNQLERSTLALVRLRSSTQVVLGVAVLAAISLITTASALTGGVESVPGSPLIKLLARQPSLSSNSASDCVRLRGSRLNPSPSVCGCQESLYEEDWT